MMRKIILNLIAVAAVVGWIVAFLSMTESSDLEGRLAVATTKLSEASERLKDAQTQLLGQQNALGNLQDIDEHLVAKQAEALALAEEIEARTSELGALRQELDTGKIELGALADRVAASGAVLSRLTRDQEGTKTELDRLQTEAERQRAAAIVASADTQAPAPKASAVSKPAVAVTAPAISEVATGVTTAAEIPAADPLADARRRFARIDQDGDGRFDRIDFRLKRVSLFGKVDANADDYLTPDETLLSPEAFRIFDSDGDGKISSLEMADRRSFSVMDTDGDEFVTFDEYAKFLRVNTE
jgi:peptidoglycan hydrolase CwlO-like protein